MGIGAIVGAVAGGVGNYFAAKDAQKQANKNQRRAEQHEINILKNQVQWRTADAIAAGLHPLAALGLNPASSGVGAAQAFAPDYGSMGADLGRAIDSALPGEKQIQANAIRLGMEKVALENDYVKTQIASQRMRNIQQAAPGVPQNLGNEVNGSIPIPGTDERIKQEFPNLAQQAENAYGEIGGELFGIGNLAVDAYRYLQFENLLTGDNYIPQNFKSAPGQGGQPDFSNAM